VISENPTIGINLSEQVNCIHEFYKTKILNENISKAVIGIFEKKEIVAKGEFEKYKARKAQQRTAKIDSIMNLIEKIAQKAQDKKVQSVMKEFEESLEAKAVAIPENKEYKKATYKMKFIKDRITATRKEFLNKLTDPQFSY
jgi:hypothetical protein